MLITIAALLAYSLTTFLGLEYLLGGRQLVAIPLTLVSVAVLAYSILIMCRSKASRDKRSGLPREMSSFFIVCTILLAGSVPFTQFFYIYDHQQDMKSCMAEMKTHVSEMDSLYLRYAHKRVRMYRKQLREERKKKALAQDMEKSLERRLVPASIDTVQAIRSQWLRSLKEPSVWNPLTPKHIHEVLVANKEWTEQYQQLSAITYQGEDTAPFSSENYDSEAEESLREFLMPQKPDSRSLLIMTGCWLLILTHYFHIRRPKNRFEGRHR